MALHVSTEKDEAIKDVAPKRTFQKKKEKYTFLRFKCIFYTNMYPRSTECEHFCLKLVALQRQSYGSTQPENGKIVLKSADYRSRNNARVGQEIVHMECNFLTK